MNENVQPEIENQPMNCSHPELGEELTRMKNDGIKGGDAGRLREIIKQIGWPTISKVGKKGYDAAVQIALAADHDPELQKNVLTFLFGRKEYAPHDIDLTDVEKVRQLVESRFPPQPLGKMPEVHNLEAVNKHRKNWGLPPLKALLAIDEED